MQLPNLHSISIQLALLQRTVFMLTLNIFFKNHSRKRKEKNVQGSKYFFLRQRWLCCSCCLDFDAFVYYALFPEVVLCSSLPQYLPFTDTEHTDIPTIVLSRALGLDWVDEHVWAYWDDAVITSVKWTLIDCTASSFIFKAQPCWKPLHYTSLLISCF